MPKTVYHEKKAVKVGRQNAVRSEVRLVTPEEAQQFVDLRFDGQRSVRSWWVNYLAEEMRRGAWRDGTQVNFVESDGRLHLVNGQHTCLAIVKSGLPQVLDVLYTEGDPADEYYKHDVGLKRTAGDMFAAYNLPAELGLSATQANKLGSAVRFWWRGFRRETAKNRIHPDELLKLTRHFGDAAGLYTEIVAGAPRYISNSLWRASTLAVALVTIHYATTKTMGKTEEFWRACAFGDNLDSGDPRKYAHSHLVQTGMMGGARVVSRKQITAERSARTLINYWEHWWAGNQLKGETKVFSDIAPVTIRNTPLNEYSGESGV